MAVEIGGRGVPREGTDDLRVEVIAAELEAWFGRQPPPCRYRGGGGSSTCSTQG